MSTQVTKGGSAALINAYGGTSPSGTVAPPVGMYNIWLNGVQVQANTYYNPGAMAVSNGINLRAYQGGTGEIDAAELQILNSSTLAAAAGYILLMNSGTWAPAFIVLFDLV